MTQNIKEKEIQLTTEKPKVARVYKITSDSFAAQIKDMDHKDLIAILNQIKNELDKRTADAEELVKVLKGGKG